MQFIYAVALMLGLGLAFGLILGYFSKKFHVHIDPRIEKVGELLPGANCGACGRSGCAAFAEEIVKENADPALCSPGGEETAQNIANFLGIKAESKEKTVTQIYCNGSNDKCGLKFEYQGVQDCKSLTILHGGNRDCNFGCLGLLDCMRACPFDAIEIGEDQLPHIIKDKCVACAKCISACPKKLITLIPYKKTVHILCSSHDKGAIVNKTCKAGCIGCMKCVKECPVTAIAMDNFLANIDYEKCINCGKCVKVCPKNVIENQKLVTANI